MLCSLHFSHEIKIAQRKKINKKKKKKKEGRGEEEEDKGEGEERTASLWKHYWWWKKSWLGNIARETRIIQPKNTVGLLVQTRAPGGLTLTWIYVSSLWCTYIGVCHQLEKLWGPSPGPPWGHVYQLNNSESPTPKDVFWIRWNSYFLGPLPKSITPPPPPGPLGPPWELPWTTLILHIRRYLNTT